MEHKISKFQWFNEIPSHWKESKISYLFEIGRGRVISGPELKEGGLYPVYSSQTKNDGCMGMIDTYDFDDHLITWTTDGANAGTIFIRSGKFNCTNVCGTLKPVVDADLKYYYYYLQFVTQFYKRPDTNGAKIMNNEMASIHALVPPVTEQAQIANFLDQKTAQIDTIIEKKQKLLQLLDEKRKSVINEAVTGQKVWDGNAWVKPSEVKESGVEWIGEIPVDWSVLKMRRILELKSGDFISANDIEAEGVYPVYGGNGIRGYTTKFNREGTFPLIGRQGALCGNVNYSSGKFWATEHALLVYPLKDLNLSYYGELLEVMNLNQYSVASAQPGLSVERLLDLEILFPPVSNQILIADFITKQRSKFNDIMEKVSLQIIKLQEYRQSLISEAVTGKIDVTNFN